MLRCRKLKPMKDKKCAVKKQSLLVPQTGYSPTRGNVTQ